MRSKSAAMRRASMSAVTCGIVAPRAPASLAALRARVWEMDQAVGAMKTRVRLDDLVPVAGKAPRPPERGRKRGAETVAAGAIAAPEARCDVRGLRADEAMREIELALDRAYSEGPSVISILHGHGTGALKKAIREALEASPYVATSRPGERHEGGDAVTVVQLRS